MKSAWRGANVSRNLSNLKTLSSMEFAAAAKQTTRKFSMKRAESTVRTEEFTPQRWKVLGVNRTFADDFCFKCLELSWWELLLFVASVYACVGFICAALFYGMVLWDDKTLGTDTSQNAPNAMADMEVCLWYSVTNLVTTGYGAVVPATRLAYTLSTVEQFAGLLLSALLLGIVVTKASVPSSKLIFSKTCVMNKRDGMWTLMCRVGNARGNFLYSPEIRMCYLCPMTSREGERLWEEVRLDVVETVALKPVFYVTHALTRASPLHGKSPADLERERGFLVLTVAATDDLSLQTLYARMIYRASDIRWGHRFEEVLVERRAPSGQPGPTAAQLSVDFLRFHNTHPMPQRSAMAAASAPSLCGSDSDDEDGAVVLPRHIGPDMAPDDVKQLLRAVARLCARACGDAEDERLRMTRAGLGSEEVTAGIAPSTSQAAVRRAGLRGLASRGSQPMGVGDPFGGGLSTSSMGSFATTSSRDLPARLRSENERPASGPLSNLLKPLQGSTWRANTPERANPPTPTPPLAPRASRRLDAPAASGAFSAISEGDEGGSESVSGEASGRADSGPRRRRAGSKSSTADNSIVMGIFARGAPEPSERGSFEEDRMASGSSRSEGIRSGPAAPLSLTPAGGLDTNPSVGPSAKEILGPSPFSASFVEDVGLGRAHAGDVAAEAARALGLPQALRRKALPEGFSSQSPAPGTSACDPASRLSAPVQTMDSSLEDRLADQAGGGAGHTGVPVLQLLSTGAERSSTARYSGLLAQDSPVAPPSPFGQPPDSGDGWAGPSSSVALCRPHGTASGLVGSEKGSPSSKGATSLQPPGRALAAAELRGLSFRARSSGPPEAPPAAVQGEGPAAQGHSLEARLTFGHRGGRPARVLGVRSGAENELAGGCLQGLDALPPELRSGNELPPARATDEADQAPQEMAEPSRCAHPDDMPFTSPPDNAGSGPPGSTRAPAWPQSLQHKDVQPVPQRLRPDSMRASVPASMFGRDTGNKHTAQPLEEGVLEPGASQTEGRFVCSSSEGISASARAGSATRSAGSQQSETTEGEGPPALPSAAFTAPDLEPDLESQPKAANQTSNRTRSGLLASPILTSPFSASPVSSAGEAPNQQADAAPRQACAMAQAGPPLTPASPFTSSLTQPGSLKPAASTEAPALAGAGRLTSRRHVTPFASLFADSSMLHTTSPSRAETGSRDLALPGSGGQRRASSARPLPPASQFVSENLVSSGSGTEAPAPGSPKLRPPAAGRMAIRMLNHAPAEEDATCNSTISVSAASFAPAPGRLRAARAASRSRSLVPASAFSGGAEEGLSRDGVAGVPVAQARVAACSSAHLLASPFAAQDPDQKAATASSGRHQGSLPGPGSPDGPSEAEPRQEQAPASCPGCPVAPASLAAAAPRASRVGSRRLPPSVFASASEENDNLVGPGAEADSNAAAGP